MTNYSTLVREEPYPYDRLMIHEQYRVAALSSPGKIAVIGHHGTLTYGQLSTEASRLALEIRRLGATDGDRIAVYMPNGIEAAVAIWAVWEAGCVLVPLHAAARKDALLPILEQAEPQMIIADNELASVLGSLIDANDGIKRIVVWCRNADSPPRISDLVVPWPPANQQVAVSTPLPASRRDENSLAALIFTSGSTGPPKGVMLSHANMQAAMTAVNAYLKLCADDVIYTPLSLASSYGLYQLVLGLAIGATVVLDRTFAFPAHSMSLAAKEKATVFAGVPTMYAWMVSTPTLEQFDLSTLRILTSAAAALPTQHARQICERLPNSSLYIMYGQTECKRISYLDPADIELKPGSVGRGMPYQQHAIINDEGLPVEVGEVGELVVRGPHVMLGYWRNPDATAQKLRPIAGREGNWLHTGDLFRVDADGYLNFVGRHDDILMVGGNKVSPAHVEDILCQMPEVLEAAVTSMPDLLWGEAVKAHLVWRPGKACTSDAVIRFCKPRLPGYMVPKAVVFVSALPKTESGKVKKRDLT